MSRFDLSLFTRAADAAVSRFAVEILEECESSNTVLLEKAARGAALGTVALALRQTAGRGRCGRAWISSPENSLTFSFLWSADPARGGLSLAAGLALCRALENLGARSLALKWPNDLFLAASQSSSARPPRKLAGILAELCKTPNMGWAAVIGVGLNLVAPATETAAGLAEAFPAENLPPRPEILLAGILGEIARTLEVWEKAGFAALREDWRARHLWENQAVILRDAETICAEGICRGVDDEGALLLEARPAHSGGAAEIRRFLAGDLSLRAAEAGSLSC
ncbi:MAG: biotin--[acetyl-CoA-carboxylase] ligase [Zoogloeaceae bacterium]|jgi:BirA family biotin operon repressor/biotin-[acetyl-CoA-carboxylase] ligase|nr:biotin--[acetyl-CoA-carboxylase] ligase [Zoogloeaceae bacterium]